MSMMSDMDSESSHGGSSDLTEDHMELVEGILGQRAFQLLHGASLKYDQRCRENEEDSSMSDDSAPCLSKEPPFPCMVCGSMFSNFHSAKMHASAHQAEKAGKSNLTCTFCGKFFHSVVTLQMHQIAEPLPRTCPLCLEKFDCPEDQEAHLCRKGKAKVNWKACKENYFKCPLGCEKRYHLEKEKMRDHLITLHGCDEDAITFNSQLVSVDILESSKCSLCECTIDVSTRTEEEHMIHFCAKRNLVLREFLKTYQLLSEASGISEETFVRLELEAYMAEWINVKAFEEKQQLSQENKSYIELGKQKDLKYSFLPKNFYLNFLSSVPVGLSTLSRNSRDFGFQMELWNSTVNKSVGFYKSRLLKHNMIRFHRKIRELLKNENKNTSDGPSIHDNDEKEYISRMDSLRRSQPPREVLERLENELGFEFLDVTDQSLLKRSRDKLCDVPELDKFIAIYKNGEH